ncbi:hypothetical protein LI951_01405 [Enterococcus sp. BWT-B8]|uniref:hypothetical protein n=1 Tax=Enterococcus sp. BWT-B8 TaxID=2885157 RepID=UPI001E2AC0CD|nr:hypothetical protein [Enterococcus sp. BWT-B8]MCB5950718.1 hypothetical protein [Enterococcus sp. BWT-B8]
MTMTTDCTLIIDSPFNGENSVPDYEGAFNDFDCQRKLRDGYWIGISDTSDQTAAVIYFNSTQQADTLIHLQAADGNEVAAFKTSKNFDYVVVNMSEIVSRKTLALYSGGESTGTSSFGFYQNGSYSRGSELGTLNEQTTSVSQDGLSSFRQTDGRPRRKITKCRLFYCSYTGFADRIKE